MDERAFGHALSRVNGMDRDPTAQFDLPDTQGEIVTAGSDRPPAWRKAVVIILLVLLSLFLQYLACSFLAHQLTMGEM
jgi:hypothetical protein